MKNYIYYRIALVAATLAGAAQTQGDDDLQGTVRFYGSVRNGVSRQTVQGAFSGKGEFDLFNYDADINGTIRTQAGQRPSQFNVLGFYPADGYIRGNSNGPDRSDNFGTRINLSRRSFTIRGLGTIVLDRPIDPRRPGRQNLRGKGNIGYNF